MISTQTTDEARKLIYCTMRDLSKQCEQFMYSIFQRIQREQTDLALTLINSVLNNFTEVSRNCLKKITENVLSSIFPSNEDSQGLSSNEKKFSNTIEGMRVHSESLKLGESSIENLTSKQEIEDQMMLNNQGLAIDDDQGVKYCLNLIVNKLGNQKGQMSRFKQCLLQDFEQSFEKRQMHGQEIWLNQNKNGLLLTQVSNLDKQLIDQQLVSPQQLLKKKKNQFQGIFVMQTSQQNKLDLLKQLHFNRIIRMKQKYCKIGMKLFPKQLKILWLFKLTDQEIKEKIINCNKSKLEILKNQFRQWRKQLQQRSLQIDQTCHMHKNKVYYLCLNQTIKKNIYLCNQCFQDKTILSKHYNHEIMCKEHRKTIKYKQYPQFQQIDEQISSEEQQPFKQQQQKLMCQQCPHSSTKRVSSCHYQEIRLLCIQQKCVQMGVHIICPVCQSANHKDHSVVEYNKDKMMEKFRMPLAIDVTQYEQLLIKAKGMLSFSLFQKIKRGFAEQALPILRFLEAFGVYSSEEVEKRINKFIAEQQWENLMILTAVLRMKGVHQTEESRLSYLQVLNSMLEAEFQAIVKSIQEMYKQSCVRIKEAINRSKEQVEAELNRKYRQIINIEVDDAFVASPMRLGDVHPLHYHRIEKITIEKEGEQQRDQDIRKERRNNKVMFFKQIKNKLLERNVGEQHHLKYSELLILRQQQYKYDENYSILNQKEQKIIDSLFDQYKKASSQGDLTECLLLKQIMLNKFNHLKVINIQYLNYKPFYYKYSVDGFAVFEFISNNPQFQQVTIRGVQVKRMQQFIDSPSTNSLSLQKIKKVKHLRLAINFQYKSEGWLTDKSNTFPFVSCLQNLSYFRKHFYQLSQITVGIRFGKSDQGNILERLLLCLKAIKKIKIEIGYFEYSLLKQLLNGLASLTEITSLSFHGINQGYNQTMVSTEDYSSMEASLADLFSRNTITHLKLFCCDQFPSLPKITTLQSIQIWATSFKGEFDLSFFIKANTKLKQIDISQMPQYNLTIEEQLFNQLQYLSINYLNILSFVYTLPSPSNLKYLSIENEQKNRFIDISTLQPIFPKLANIIQLQLSYLDFGYQHLSAIPSKCLEKLLIQGNNKITDECLQLIDSKWPYLNQLTLDKCRLITERIFSLCRFKCLMWISVDQQKMSMLGRRHLMKRGIQLF